MLDDLRLWMPVAIGLANLAFITHVYRLGARKAAVEDMEQRLGQISAGTKADVAAVRERMEAIDDELRGRDDETVAKLAGVHDRLMEVEGELEHLPTKDQVHKLEIQVTSIQGSVATMAAGMQMLTATTTRVENYLLERGNNK